MPKYKVYGEYGPVSDMSIVLEIDADNEGHAKNIFCETMEMQHPHEWSRMGRHNVSVQPHVEPKKLSPVLTTWEVRIKNRMTSGLVRAKTFLEAVEEAKRYCKENNASESDLLAVTYLMY